MAQQRQAFTGKPHVPNVTPNKSPRSGSGWQCPNGGWRSRRHAEKVGYADKFREQQKGMSLRPFLRFAAGAHVLRRSS